MNEEKIETSDAVALDRTASAALGLGAQLGESCSKIEGSFSATGDRLIECAMRLNEVSSAHEGLPGALNGEDFATAEATLASISAELMHIAGSDFGEDAAIGQLRDLAARMGEPLVELRRVMLLLEIISANAGILAAEISDTGNGLSAFTGDMVSLANSALSGISSFEHLRIGLLGNLSGAAAAGERFARTHADTLSQVRDRLDGHVAAILRHRQSGGMQLSDNAAATRRIAGQVAEVVSAMQIGDITRQRIEHIEYGLSKLATLFQPDDGDGPPNRSATAALLRGLQEAQLRSTIQDFRERTSLIAASLPDLASDTQRVLADGDRQARELTDTSNDTLSGMLEDLRKVRLLFSDFRSVRGEADRMSEAVTQAIDKMVSQLRTIDRIERQIRVLSFNMAAQCNRLGEEGRAMMVITQQLRELAIRTESASELVRGRLGEAARAAESISGAHGRTEKLAELDSATEDAVTRIEAASAEMRGHARTLVERGPGALDILRKAADAAQMLGDAERVWSDILDGIERLEIAGSQDGEVDGAMFADLRRTYTMDSERRVHDEIVGNTGEADHGVTAGDAAADTAPAGGADEDDDFLSALF